MQTFREFLAEASFQYKTKAQDGFDYMVTLSTINKITNKRQLETLYFRNELEAIGYAEKTKKEIEAKKDLAKS